MESLKAEIEKSQGLDSRIIAELLTHLRYLVKHVAFKGEQECRLIKVERLKNNNNIKVEDKARVYMDYIPMEQYVTDIYFGPRATDFELFRDRVKHSGLDINFHKSVHPFLG